VGTPLVIVQDLQTRLKDAVAAVDDVLKDLEDDGSAEAWLVEYRLTEAGLQLRRAARDLAER
jgi:hypothetical protein